MGVRTSLLAPTKYPGERGVTLGGIWGVSTSLWAPTKYHGERGVTLGWVWGSEHLCGHPQSTMVRGELRWVGYGGQNIFVGTHKVPW